MKQIFVLLAMLSLISCSKTENFKEDSSKNDISLSELAIQHTLKNPNKEIQKTMYRSLNHFEKNELWQQKFENYLANTQLSAEQRTFIQSVADLLCPEIFAEKSVSANTLNERGIRAKAIDLFGAKEAAFIFADISLTSQSKDAPPEGGTGCKCSRTSDWCATYMTCAQLPCDTQDGCGFLWQHLCNGMCSI